MKIQTLHKTDWIELRRMIDPDNDIYGYDYIHESRCNGEIIAVLPFRIIRMDGKKEYLLRREVTPPWHPTENFVSSITGGLIDNDPIKTVIQEVWEEAGYRISDLDIYNLGSIKGTKSCDTDYRLFGVNLIEYKKEGEGSGDGSKLEAKAWCEWYQEHEIIKAHDPLVYALHYRLNDRLNRWHK